MEQFCIQNAVPVTRDEIKSNKKRKKKQQNKINKQHKMENVFDKVFTKYVELWVCYCVRNLKY